MSAAQRLPGKPRLVEHPRSPWQDAGAPECTAHHLPWPLQSLPESAMDG